MKPKEMMIVIAADKAAKSIDDNKEEDMEMDEEEMDECDCPKCTYHNKKKK
jgi:hypothetical protein